MHVVFDTNVLISSTLWDGSVAQKLLFRLIRLDIPIFSSKEILSEYQKVLKRDFEYSDDDAVKIMDVVLSFITFIEPSRKVNAVQDDPDDNKVIECALASSSKYVITYDNHLLKLKKHENIRIITPEEALMIF